jgi:preprotein translocase SecE subunit
LEKGRKIREGDTDRFEADDFINRGSLVVKKEAFDRVQKAAKDKVASFDPKLPTAADVLDRYYVQQKNKELENNYVRITKATPRDKDKFKVGDVVPASDFESVITERKQTIESLEEEAEKLRNQNLPGDALRKEKEADGLKRDMPTSTTPAQMDGAVQFETITLIPWVRIVMPLLLGAVALWFSWRLVNLPSFADFLIATEAELNKVSWTPRRRLVQDTIVVLVTTLLITFFLLFADLIWSQLLTRIGVLRAPSKETSAEVQPGGDELPW